MGKFFGDEAIDGLLATIKQYRVLLFETRKCVAPLLASAALQHQNARDLLEIIEQRKWSRDEEEEFKECLQFLAEWIDQEALTSLSVSWSEMIEKLEEEQKQWKKRGNCKKAFWALVAGALAGAMILAGVIVIACGVSAAAPMAAPVIGTAAV